MASLVLHRSNAAVGPAAALSWVNTARGRALHARRQRQLCRHSGDQAWQHRVAFVDAARRTIAALPLRRGRP